jgi:NAD(P)-dependent dehydrogenase (short-subunit alcohol dehydrogenase family)
MPVALVTGASRGVGKGVATALHASGYRVFATGRTIETVSPGDLPAGITRIRCDHTNDDDTAAAFARVAEESPSLDVVVNNSWGGYERMMEGGQFTWGLPFWQQPVHRWSSMMDAGVRAAWVVSSRAVPLMMQKPLANGRGLIVNISVWAAQKFIGNTLYGVSKAATDKLTADMAHELRKHGISVVSLYPGLVRTEAVLAAASQGWFKLDNSESPEFLGLVIAALAADPRLSQRSGTVVVAAQAAREFGITDVDGKQPAPLTLETA